MFAISGRDLPYVNTYEKAQEVWAKSHEHDRFGPNTRGLANKRDTSKTITNQDGVYQFTYYSTAMVEWWRDLLCVRTYDSSSSITFSNRFLPRGIVATSHGGVMYILYKDLWLKPKHGQLEFRLKKGEWVLDESTAAETTTYILDRKLAAHVRKKLQPLRDHRDALLHIRGGRHNAELRSERAMCQLLHDALMFKALDDSIVRELLKYLPAYDDDILLPNAYLISGAVKTAEGIGLKAPHNRYQGRAGCMYI